MSASIAARISTRPILCLVDRRWEASAAVLRVASAHVRTLDYAISFARVHVMIARVRFRLFSEATRLAGRERFAALGS